MSHAHFEHTLKAVKRRLTVLVKLKRNLATFSNQFSLMASYKLHRVNLSMNIRTLCGNFAEFASKGHLVRL